MSNEKPGTEILSRSLIGSLQGFKPPTVEPPETLVGRDDYTPDRLKRIIREMGLKVTHQRLGILEALVAGRAHVTAQEVYEKVSQVDSDMGFATVYRFLRKMKELSFVTEVRMGGLPARYELTPKRHHDHLTCSACGRIIEFENREIENLQQKVAESHDFLLSGHVLELYGVCGSCQRKGVTVNDGAKNQRKKKDSF